MLHRANIGEFKLTDFQRKILSGKKIVENLQRMAKRGTAMLLPIHKIDKLCDEFESAHAAGEAPDILCYVQKIDEPLRGQLFEQLFLLEMEIAGSKPTRQHYLDRFQEHAPVINRFFDALIVETNHDNQKTASEIADHSAGESAPSLTEIGPFKIERLLGEGGMGAVYLATQFYPVKRQVAIKLIKRGMDSKQVVARFEAERQALAMMDHPNIAKVFDGGTTDSGQPYFAMEYVDGIPLDDFCQHHNLTVDERLKLFLDVCAAIRHAHQKGILHRDIKPSNILVGQPDDNEPANVKVIDFGLAKALDVELTDKTIATQLHQAIGTLQYMSPEQTELGKLNVDTRADIYSLGVVLYELLTGSPPLHRDELMSESLDSVMRLVREKEAPRPSSRLGSSWNNSPSSTSVSNRNEDAFRLKRAMKKELDWIVLKAIEKDRDRRYESVAELSADIRRYLANEVVLARPPTYGYTLGKFVHRNRALVATAATIATMLIVATGVSTYMYVRAETARSDLKLESDAKQKAIDELKTSATNGMIRLGDSALKNNKPDEAAVWFAEAAQRTETEPDRLRANLMRLAAASKRITIPTAAITVPRHHASELIPHISDNYLIVRNWSSAAPAERATVWDMESEKCLLLTTAAQWVGGGERILIARDGQIQLLSFPELEVLDALPETYAKDISVDQQSRFASVVTDSSVKTLRLTDSSIALHCDYPIVAARATFSSDSTHLLAWSKAETQLVTHPVDSHSAWKTCWKRNSIPDSWWENYRRDVEYSIRHLCHPRFFGESNQVVMLVSGHLDTPLVSQIQWPGNEPQREPFVSLVAESGDVKQAFTRYHPARLFGLSRDGKKLTMGFSYVENYSIEPDPNRDGLFTCRKIGKVKHMDPVMGWARTSDDKFISAGTDGFVYVSESSGEEEPLVAIRHQNEVVAVALGHNENNVFTGQTDGLVRRWSLGSLEHHVEPSFENSFRAYHITFSPDDTHFAPSYAIGKRQRKYVFVAATDGSLAGPSINLDGWLSHSLFDETGDVLVTASTSGNSYPSNPQETGNGWIDFWDWRTGEVAGEQIDLKSEPLGLGMLNKTLIVVCKNGSVLWIDTLDGQVKHEKRFGVPKFWANRTFLTPSPDDSMLVLSGIDYGLRFLDDQGQVLKTLDILNSAGKMFIFRLMVNCCLPAQWTT